MGYTIEVLEGGRAVATSNQLNLEPRAAEFDNITTHYLAPSPGLGLVIHCHLTIPDKQFRLATSGNQAFELEDFVKLNGLPCNCYYSH